MKYKAGHTLFRTPTSSAGYCINVLTATPPTHTTRTHAHLPTHRWIKHKRERERSGINGNIQRSIVTAVEILTRGHSEMYQKDTSKRPFPSKLFAMFAKLFIVVGRFVDSTHSA